MLHALAENSAFQDVLISIRTKGIEVRADTPSVPDLSVLTEPQFQTVLRSFNEQKGSVIHMGEPVMGRKIMLFLTASLVDPSGEELSMAAAMKKRRKGSVFPSGDYCLGAGCSILGAGTNGVSPRLLTNPFLSRQASFRAAEAESTTERLTPSIPVLPPVLQLIAFHSRRGIHSDSPSRQK